MRQNLPKITVDPREKLQGVGFFYETIIWNQNTAKIHQMIKYKEVKNGGGGEGEEC